jgi:hypothetical protein
MILTHPVDCTQLSIPVYVFFGLFCALTIVECIFAFLEKEGPRKIIKPFCVLMLAVLAIIFQPSAGSSTLELCSEFLGISSSSGNITTCALA